MRFKDMIIKYFITKSNKGNHIHKHNYIDAIIRIQTGNSCNKVSKFVAVMQLE